MGEIVRRLQMPFVWIPGQLPFHVTKKDQLRIVCPFKYGAYADRVDANCPIFRTFVNAIKGKEALSWASLQASPGQEDGNSSELVLGPDEEIDLPMSVPSDPVEPEAVPDVRKVALGLQSPNHDEQTSTSFQLCADAQAADSLQPFFHREE